MKYLKYISAIFLALTLVSTLGCATSDKSPGEYLDDKVVTARVKKAIFDEPTLKSSEISVETYKGVVQLSGFVSSKDDIRTAVEVTRGVKGVSSVKNDMRVKPGN
jgi:osmotically-inducible protein OsmY